MVFLMRMAQVSQELSYGLVSESFDSFLVQEEFLSEEDFVLEAIYRKKKETSNKKGPVRGPL